MDELVDQFTKETGIKVAQQRITWPSFFPRSSRCQYRPGGSWTSADPPRRDPATSRRTASSIHGRGHACRGRASRRGLHPVDLWRDLPGQRYSIPLDVPQHILYFNVKYHEECRFVGAGRSTEGDPSSGAELVAMANSDHQGGHVRIRRSAAEPISAAHLWLHQMLWQNQREHLHSDLKRAGVAEPAAVEGPASSGARSMPSTRWRRREHEVPETPSSRGSSASGWPAPGTLQGFGMPRRSSRWRRCPAY